LQAVVRGEQPASALGAVIDGVTYRPRATDDGLAWELQTGRAGEAAVRAVLAWDRLQVSSPGRLRPCANTECRLFLVDRSHANTAKWCSMALCGNRMKARRHYGRGRPPVADPD
jgi:predicted RNA-binding Zn ribbon-like protein